MEPQDSQNPVQFAPESSDKLPLSSLTTPPKKNISSGEDAFFDSFKEELNDCTV
jgi:hypothetical protein